VLTLDDFRGAPYRAWMDYFFFTAAEARPSPKSGWQVTAFTRDLSLILSFRINILALDLLEEDASRPCDKPGGAMATLEIDKYDTPRTLKFAVACASPEERSIIETLHCAANSEQPVLREAFERAYKKEGADWGESSEAAQFVSETCRNWEAASARN
jgi:hypothetical protein